MLRIWRTPLIIRGTAQQDIGRRRKVSDGRYASFMSVETSRHLRNSDRYERKLRFIQFTGSLTKLAAVIGATWVVVESAKALVIF